MYYNYLREHTTDCKVHYNALQCILFITFKWSVTNKGYVLVYQQSLCRLCVLIPASSWSPDHRMTGWSAVCEEVLVFWLPKPLSPGQLSLGLRCCGNWVCHASHLHMRGVCHLFRLSLRLWKHLTQVSCQPSRILMRSPVCYVSWSEAIRLAPPGPPFNAVSEMTLGRKVLPCNFKDNDFLMLPDPYFLYRPAASDYGREQ